MDARLNAVLASFFKILVVLKYLGAKPERATLNCTRKLTNKQCKEDNTDVILSGH